MDSTAKRVTRLSHVLSRRIEFNEINGLDVSHLCHNRRCVLPEHLTAESREENNYRKACVSAGQCAGHGDKPACLLHLKRFASCFCLGWYITILTKNEIYTCPIIQSVIPHMCGQR